MFGSEADKTYVCGTVFLPILGRRQNEAAFSNWRVIMYYPSIIPYKTKIIAFPSRLSTAGHFYVSVGGQPKYADGLAETGRYYSCAFNDLDAVKQ